MSRAYQCGRETSGGHSMRNAASNVLTLLRGTLVCVGLIAIVASSLFVPAVAATYTATFTPISTSNTPLRRAWTAMTWFGSLNRIVMWGGSGADFYNDIQALDPVNAGWITLDTQAYCPGNTSFLRPNASDENGVVWDSISNLLWIYNGGSGYRCASPQNVGHTAGAGTTSTSIVDPTLPATTDDFYKDWQVRAPDGTQVYVTAYSAATKTLSLGAALNVSAGSAYDLYVDFGGGTWWYDFASGQYSKLSQVHWGYTGYVPAYRESPGFAGDGTKAFLFGGLSYDNGTYKLDFTTRAYSIAIPQGASTSPAARGQIQNQFVYDSTDNLYVLFGGRCYDPARCSYQAVLSDTWVYDPVANAWTPITGGTQPPARNQAQMYFDQANGVVVLYGGFDGTKVFNDLWTFDPKTLTWTQQTIPTVNPGGIYLGQIAYAPTTNCGYLVYGLISGSISTGGQWQLCLSPTGTNLPPQASFTATPSTTTTGTPIALSATASFDPDGSIVSYAWNFGDGTTGSGVTTSKTYTTAGTYTVTLTVTDNSGATGSTTGTIIVTTGTTTVWVEDAVPAGASIAGSGEGWNWISSNPAPYSGTLAHQSALLSGLHQHYFIGATATLAVVTGDTLFTYVYLDPANPPSEVMLQWNDGTWEHRAYWGANLIAWGTDGTVSRRYMGPLPATGQWVQLAVPASQVGLEGRTLNGMAYTLYNGRATWDYAGKTAGTAPVTYQVSGTATLNGGALSGVTMTATNGVTCSTTDTSGNYACTVPQGWSGTVTPSLSGYTFTPTSLSYSNVTTNQTAQNYAAAVVTGTVWVEDAVPAGASIAGSGEGWNWISSNPAPYSGTLAHQSALLSGLHQHYFIGATATLAVVTGDTLFTYVYLDPANPPSEVMLQWNDGTWEHRAYWGANSIAWGTDGTVSRRYMGPLPATGQWVQLAVPASQVGLEGRTLNGMAYTLYNGRATWDYAGKTAGTAPVTYQVSGTVTLNGSALSGVTTTATNGVTCSTTDTSGNYACTVPQGWSGTVTPSLSGYTFTPTSLSYSNVTTNQTAQNYAAAVVTGTVWVEDAVPAGASIAGSGEGWNWISSNPAPYSGTLAHQSALLSGLHQHYFIGATTTLAVVTGDTLFTYVYLDPANPPSEVMLQWNDGTWEHRAYWGANLIAWGTDGTVSRRYMGPLPATGQWVQLAVPASQVGLAGRTLNGMAYTLYNGRATWDYAGKF